MFLYNVTIGIDQSVETQWLTWMKEIHIPAVMKTGQFVYSKFYRIVHNNDDGTTSYSIQYFAETIQHVQEYLEIYAPALIEEHRKRFKDKHVAFRTLLEEI